MHEHKEEAYYAHPIDEIEPQLSNTDAISELSERLAFMFAWTIDARDSKAVAARVWVAAHYFCPSLVDSETLAKTGERLGITRQAMSKLLIDLRDTVSMEVGSGEQKMCYGKTHSDRLMYQKSQYDRTTSDKH